jgi:hypothetical protein
MGRHRRVALRAKGELALLQVIVRPTLTGTTITVISLGDGHRSSLSVAGDSTSCDVIIYIGWKVLAPVPGSRYRGEVAYRPLARPSTHFYKNDR